MRERTERVKNTRVRCLCACFRHYCMRRVCCGRARTIFLRRRLRMCTPVFRCLMCGGVCVRAWCVCVCVRGVCGRARRAHHLPKWCFPCKSAAGGLPRRRSFPHWPTVQAKVPVALPHLRNRPWFSMDGAMGGAGKAMGGYGGKECGGQVGKKGGWEG